MTRVSTTTSNKSNMNDDPSNVKFLDTLTASEKHELVTSVEVFLDSLGLDETEVDIIKFIAPQLDEMLRKLVHGCCHIAEIDCSRTRPLIDALLAYSLNASEAIKAMKARKQ